MLAQGWHLHLFGFAVGMCGLMKNQPVVDCCCSEVEAAFYLPVSLVSRVWAAVLQPLRPSAQHQLPRRLAEPDAEVCPAAVYGSHVPCFTRAQHHPLRPQTGKHSSLQPETLGSKDRGLRQLVPAWKTCMCLSKLIAKIRIDAACLLGSHDEFVCPSVCF